MNPVAETKFYSGIEQFNNCDFFDCHDTLEELWMESKGDERLLLQGLIQVAVAYYHKGNGNFKGAESQLNKAISKLDRIPDSFCGLEMQSLLTTIRLHRTIFENAYLRKYNSHAAMEVSAPIIRFKRHM
jgi:uncharacterized protein